MQPKKRFVPAQQTAASGRIVQRHAVVTPREPAQAPSHALRLVQPAPPGGRGLAIGYGFPEDFVLPGWGLVLSGLAPNQVDLYAARRLASVPATTPLLLIGNGAGVRTAFAAFIANHTATVAGGAFFGDGFPSDAYSLSLWIHLAERSAEKKGLRLVVDLQEPDKTLSALLGTALAPAEGPKGETPAARITRLLVTTFGPSSPAMPLPIPPVEHFIGTATE